MYTNNANKHTQNSVGMHHKNKIKTLLEKLSANWEFFERGKICMTK